MALQFTRATRHDDVMTGSSLKNSMNIELWLISFGIAPQWYIKLSRNVSLKF